MTQAKQDQSILLLCQRIKTLQDKDYAELNIPPEVDLNFYSTKTHGWLPIHFAAKLGKENIMKCLIDKGADPFLNLKSIDKSSGLEMKWKTGFNMIEQDDLRLRIRDYYKEVVDKYNSDSFIGLPYPVISIILSHFLPSFSLFSNLFFATKTFSLLFSPYIEMCDTIANKKKSVRYNLRQIRFFENYCEAEAREYGDPVYSPKQREDEIVKCHAANNTLQIEITTLHEELYNKLKA